MRNRNIASNTSVLIQKFEKEMKLQGKARRTIVTYSNCITRFLRHYQGKDATKFTLNEIYDYQEYLIDQKLRPSYINQHLYAINFFYTYIIKTRRFQPRDIGRVPVKPHVPEVIPRETIKKIFDATTDIKFKMIFILMYSTGMRLHEAVKLRVGDIKSDRMLIHVVGKGNKERYVPMDKDLLYKLRYYYAKHQVDKKEWMFPKERNMFHHVSTHHVQSVLRRIKAELKLAKEYTCHSFRHSFASHMLESGVDIRVIQKVLGHVDIKTTMHYTSVDENTLRKLNLPASRIA